MTTESRGGGSATPIEMRNVCAVALEDNCG